MSPYKQEINNFMNPLAYVKINRMAYPHLPLKAVLNILG